MRKLLCEQANLQNSTWKCSAVGIILNCNRLKGAQHGPLPVLPARDFGRERRLPGLYIKHKQKDDDRSAQWTDKPLVPPRNWGRKKKQKILSPSQWTTVLIPNTSTVFEVVLMPPPQGAKRSQPPPHPPRPRPCLAVPGAAPLHPPPPGLHPAAPHRSQLSQFGSARDNRFLYTMLKQLKGSALTKATVGKRFGQEKNQERAKAPSNLR